MYIISSTTYIQPPATAVIYYISFNYFLVNM